MLPQAGGLLRYDLIIIGVGWARDYCAKRTLTNQWLAERGVPVPHPLPVDDHDRTGFLETA